MQKYTALILATTLSLLCACSPVKQIITNQYKLDSFSDKTLRPHQTHASILISPPEAVAGYQTEQMLYVNKPFELASFAHSSWIAPPADMLYPLIVQSVQRSGYFYAVSSGANAEQADYRLDTQLIKLEQNFLSKPVKTVLIAKIVLSNAKNNQVIASRMIHRAIPCPTDNPYGGVVAANQASHEFTAELSHFIVREITRHRA